MGSVLAHTTAVTLEHVVVVVVVVVVYFPESFFISVEIMISISYL